ncbi:hypothetical protein GIB67_019974 [Kingdonia uniflora]|uniref:RNase H type-1 domain-containing protein n=1 Tax=Kingdonia uniflora TaxID=39325 RepID=A0A7J7ML32_9MAGN|nr:hypothetical protein GIB67_019974 [Kingdonia uniflora]
MSSSLSPLLRDLWIAAVWSTCKLIWSARNAAIFDEEFWQISDMKKKIVCTVRKDVFLTTAEFHNIVADLEVVKALRVSARCCKASRIRIVVRRLPEREGRLKSTLMGLLLAIQGREVLVLWPEGVVISVVAEGLGIVTRFFAECCAVLDSLELVASFGWEIAWMEADSTVAIKSFIKDEIPWKLLARWKLVNPKFSRI